METKREEAERLWTNQGVPHQEIAKRLAQMPDNEAPVEATDTPSGDRGVEAPVEEVVPEDEKKNEKEDSSEDYSDETTASNPEPETKEVTGTA